MICISRFQDSLCSEESNLVFRSRVAWREITTWINAYYISVFLESDSEFQQSIIKKLEKLSLEFESMIKVFFGDQMANDYAAMLSSYLILLVNYINALKNEDINMANEYRKQLDENVEQKIDFLSKMNPFWIKEELRNLMNNYTNTLIDQITAFSTKDYEKSINLYNKNLYYSSEMGDYLAKGILNYLTYNARQPKKSRKG